MVRPLSSFSRRVKSRRAPARFRQPTFDALAVKAGEVVEPHAATEPTLGGIQTWVRKEFEHQPAALEIIQPSLRQPCANPRRA
jgi:hypothetical protein